MFLEEVFNMFLNDIVLLKIQNDFHIKILESYKEHMVNHLSNNDYLQTMKYGSTGTFPKLEYDDGQENLICKNKGIISKPIKTTFQSQISSIDEILIPDIRKLTLLKIYEKLDYFLHNPPKTFDDGWKSVMGEYVKKLKIPYNSDCLLYIIHLENIRNWVGHPYVKNLQQSNDCLCVKDHVDIVLGIALYSIKKYAFSYKIDFNPELKEFDCISDEDYKKITKVLSRVKEINDNKNQD